MAVLDEVTAAVRAIEPELRRPTASAEAALRLEDRIRTIRALLAQHGDRWIGVKKAKEFLGFSSEGYVRAWARNGWLRSRTATTGRLQVSLDDVLNERERREALSAIDNSEPIPQEEALYWLRPGEYPRPSNYPPLKKQADAAP